MTESTAPLATARDELPVFFPAAGHDLFGVLTHPTGPAKDIAAVLLTGGGRKGTGGTPSPGRNRVWVRFARSAAAAGFHSLRMEFRGIGESTGVASIYRLENPWPEDVIGASQWLREHGIGDVILIGTCFGGRAGLAAAPSIERVRGVAVIAAPLRDFDIHERAASRPITWHLQRAASRETLAGIFDPVRRDTYRRAARNKARKVVARLRPGADQRPLDIGWASPQVIRSLEQLVARRVPVLFMFGDDDEYLPDFDKARTGPLKAIFRQAGDLFTVRITSGRVHGLRTIAVQDEVIRVAQAWMNDITATTSPVASTNGRGPAGR